MGAVWGAGYLYAEVLTDGWMLAPKIVSAVLMVGGLVLWNVVSFPDGSTEALWLRHHRERIYRSRESLGKVLGVSGHSVGNWERGAQYPRLDVYLRMLEEFGLKKGEGWA